MSSTLSSCIFVSCTFAVAFASSSGKSIRGSMLEAKSANDVTHTMLYNAGSDTWSHPNTVYSSLWIDQTSATIEGTTDIYTSLTDYYSDQAKDLGVGFVYGMFSGSSTMSPDREALTNIYTSEYVGTSRVTFQYKKATVDTHFILNNNWELNEAMLAMTPATTDAEFFAFFDKFGTHYARDLVLGGKLLASYSIEASDYDDSSATKSIISDAAQYRFQQLVGDPNATPTVSDADLRKFDAAASTSDWDIVAEGGDTTTSAEFDVWKNTVEDSPSVIESQISVISNLVYGLTGYQAKMELAIAMQAAMTRYFALCPSDSTGNVCSAKGTCDFEQQRCVCDTGASGGACDYYMVPEEQ